MLLEQPQPIKSYLAEHRITIRALAACTGRDRHHLGRVINGRCRVTPSLAADVATALGEPVEQLFRPEDIGVAAAYPGDHALSPAR